MSTERYFLDQLWRWKCELPEELPIIVPPYEELRVTQMSQRFIKYMENRMVMGTLRYGKWQDNKKTGTKYNRIESVEKRLNLFKETGNLEYLVDSANLLMIEFEISDHPLAHFHATDDGIHVTKEKGR